MSNALRLCIFATAAATAMAQYVREGAIGTIKPAPIMSQNLYPTIPMFQWVGKRIIFLPNGRSLRKYGYQSFAPERAQRLTDHCSYAECAGKIARVLAIEGGRYPKITVELEETKQRFVGTVYGSTLSNVTLLDDLDRARRDFSGKTLWVKSDEALTYDPASDRLGSIWVPKWGPVKVVDVIAGTSEDAPIRFLVENDRGEQGFIDAHMSDTDVPDVLAKYATFDSRFLQTDPRPRYNIPARVWRLIEREQVEIGMTKEQVVLSWGEPNESLTKTVAQNVQGGETVRAGSTSLKFSGDNEQWEYRRGPKVMLLRFKGDTVNLIETVVR